MTSLEELSRAWQSLRDKLLGRSGTEQNGGAELAARFTKSYERFRAFYEGAGPLDDVLGNVGAREHVEELRALQQLASSKGLKPDYALPETALETIGSIGQNVLLGVVMFGAGVLLFTAIKNGR